MQGPGEKVSPAAHARTSRCCSACSCCSRRSAYWFDRWGLGALRTRRGHRPVLHRRQRGAAGQDDPGRDRADLRADVLRHAAAARRDAARHGVRPARPLGDPDRRRLPAADPEFQVKPNEVDKEVPSTSAATSPRPGRRTASAAPRSPTTCRTPSCRPEQAKQETSTLPNVRLLDPAVVVADVPAAPADQGLLQVPEPARHRPLPRLRRRQRAEGHGRRRTRDRRRAPPASATGSTSHLVYTHGYGFVAAPGNQVDAQGAPAFTEKNIPPTGALGITEPRDLLRRALARRTRSSAAGRRPRARLPGRQEPQRASATTPTPARAASRSARSFNRTLYALQVQGEEPPAVRRDQLRSRGSSTTVRRASACRRPRRG